ncbi:MAG: hypothetical protein HQ537_01505 [Parcubacteria group bacterium]|nr:hypothetical protein [Parcubacteria group bacterium]
MFLLDFLEKIQKKPRYVRIQILWLAVFVCMCLIFFLWVVSLKSSLMVADEVSQTSTETKKETTSLKNAFKASIGAFFEKDLEEELEQSDNQIEPERKSEKIKPIKLPLSY